MKIACIQYAASSDWAKDVDTALNMLEDAVDNGATFAVLPEYCAGLWSSEGQLMVSAFREAEHPVLHAFADFARKHEIELLVGSIGIAADDGRRFNSSVLLSATGSIAARYDKIHLFDVNLQDQQIRESLAVAPGEQLVVSTVGSIQIGMSVCYDLRFPQIYRRYAQAGASLITIPAAFTKHTGIAHWHTLIRARAIETGCFIVAADQCGCIENGIDLYGHSIIVDPWGRIVAEAGDGPEVLVASIDLTQVAEARQNIPAWSKQPSDDPALVSLIYK